MKLALRRVRVAAEGVRDARRAWTERESLLLGCTDADGNLGIGEASPLPGYSPDALDAVETALRGLEPGAVESALASRDPLTALSALVPATLPSARMALETAGLDLLGKRQRLAAPSLLGARSDARRELAALLGPASAPSLLDAAQRAVDLGFRHLKLKLGEPEQLRAEVNGVVALREKLGPGIGLRLDANGAWSGAELERAWPSLTALGIELFEEPGEIPAQLAGQLPLGLDESLQGLNPEQVDALLSRRRPRAIVLKPTALGGLAHCRRLAELAEARGVGVVLSHTFDGPFAWRATAALALSLGVGLAHGLAPHAALSGWQAAPLPIRNGALESWTEPGLGSPAEHGFR